MYRCPVCFRLGVSAVKVKIVQMGKAEWQCNKDDR